VDVEFDSTQSARGALKQYLNKYIFLNTGTRSATDCKSVIQIDRKLIGVKIYLVNTDYLQISMKQTEQSNNFGLQFRAHPIALLIANTDSF
jgi:hypothetical protein